MTNQYTKYLKMKRTNKPVFSLGDLFKGLIGPSAAGAGGALKNAMNSTTMDSQQRKTGARPRVPKLNPDMLKPKQPMQYAQYKKPDGSGGGFGPNRPMPRFDRGMPQIPMYEDGSPLFNVQPNVNMMPQASNPQGRQVNPMGFTPGYNQEAPDPEMFLREYINRLRVR